LLDVSYRRERPDNVFVYADGNDARIIRNLVLRLGSEEKVHNALILTGALWKLERDGKVGHSTRARRVKDSFQELVGVSYREYLKIVEDL